MSRASASDRPKADSLRPLQTLWPFIRPYTGTLAAALAALLIASAAMLAMPVALRYLIDNGFAAQSETFFEKPDRMAKHHGELYGVLQDYYRIDPRNWKNHE